MSLTPGTRLGPYEVLAAIGAGGMGEVYRGRDTKLNRDVAIKVLPQAMASDAERLRRFEREAQVLAALNHQNIAAIYGLEANALVMEFVDGAMLSGPLPVDEAIAIARQIAEALEYAHEKGIVHRDLKPANVKVTSSGQVKVLDFGLAKAMAEDPASAEYGNSPTLSLAATKMGMILGTAGYMSPEQAKGAGVDKRSDIWAFGAVLFELLAGKRLIDEPTASEAMAAVLKSELNLAALPPATPPRIRRLIERCLKRDPKQRLRDIGEARIVLESPDEASDIASVPVTVARKTILSSWVFALIAVAAVAFAGWMWWKRPTAVEATPVRFTIPLPPGQEVTTYPAITRDGRTIAYVTEQGDEDTQLYLRDLNSFEARLVPGSSGAKEPFFSPDGKWVAFFAKGQLQKAEVAGGAPIRVVEANYPQGGTWSEDNTIIYASSLGSGLLRVPAGGGTPESLTKPDAAAQGYAHVFPQSLPGGRRVLFNVWGGQKQGNAVLSLDSHQWEPVLSRKSFTFGIFDALHGSTSRLLLIDPSANVLAAPFDAAHPAATSPDTTVLSNVFWELQSEARAWLAVSDTRTAVYVPGNPAKASLVWVDREGKVEALGKDQDLYREVSLSPDGARMVVRNGWNLWIHDLQRGTRSPLTSGDAASLLPIWSSDGKRILFASNQGGKWAIYSQPSDGSAPAVVLLKRSNDQFPCAMLPDGTLLYMEISVGTGRDLWTMSPDGKTTPLRVTPFYESEARLSPAVSSGSAAGWVAYTSDESGRSEVYVQAYPGGTKRVAVSNGGGSQPRWSPDGKELFYVTGEAVVAVPFRPDGSVGAPHRLFDRAYFLLNDQRFQSYQPSLDGKRFLTIRRDEGSVPRHLNVILNWSGEGDRPTSAGNK